MGATPVIKFISIEEYLFAEEISLEKNEYYKGEIFAMAGAAVAHNRVVRNTLVSVGGYLQDKSCEIFPSDLRIHIEANTLFTYPDMSIFCEQLKMYNNRSDTAVNPTVIIEVLSKSTQEYDRGTKFNLYRQLSSLNEYIMISSTEVLVERYVKQSDNEWLFTSYNTTEDFFMIESIGLSVAVKNLYRNVNFEE